MISVTILTKNSAQTLQKTLESVARFEEVIVVDTGSTDETMEIAKKFPNVKLFQNEFIGFGPSHNLAISLAKNEWILSLDSDEILSPQLVEEIFDLDLDPGSIYAIHRKNYFRGKHITSCGGWHPDIVVRLFHRQRTSFDNLEVHEKVLKKDLKEVVLAHPLFHTPYREIGDFLAKMQSYSSLFAKQYKGKKRASLGLALVHSWAAFLKSYLLKRGFVNGAEGLIISLYNGHTAFYKYLKLSELNKK